MHEEESSIPEGGRVWGYHSWPSHTTRLVRAGLLLTGCEIRKRDLEGVVSTYWGNSQHRWMWDYRSIQPELTNAGFCEIRRAHFNDSADPLFFEVEDRERWENCLSVECKKVSVRPR